VAVKLVEMVTAVLHAPDGSQLGGQEFDSRKDIDHNKTQPVARKPLFHPKSTAQRSASMALRS